MIGGYRGLLLRPRSSSLIELLSDVVFQQHLVSFRTIGDISQDGGSEPLFESPSFIISMVAVGMQFVSTH